MDGALKKGVVLVVVVFVGFYLFTDPQGLAQVSKNLGTALWHGLTQLFGAIIRFLNAVTH